MRLFRSQLFAGRNFQSQIFAGRIGGVPLPYEPMARDTDLRVNPLHVRALPHRSRRRREEEGLTMGLL